MERGPEKVMARKEGRKKAQILSLLLSLLSSSLSSLGNQSLLQVYVYVLMGGSDGGSL